MGWRTGYLRDQALNSNKGVPRGALFSFFGR